MKHITEDWVYEQTASCIAAMEGRYEQYICDECLTSIIARLVWEEYLRRDQGQIQPMLITDVAYKGSIFIFETILEHRCKAGGNGHHVAQAYASFMQTAFDLLKTNNNVSTKKEDTKEKD